MIKNDCLKMSTLINHTNEKRFYATKIKYQEN